MGHGLLGWMWWECSHYFHWLREHGVHVHQWQKPGAFHSKNMLVDDEIAAVGSYNVANGSSFHHTESAVIVYDRPFAAGMRRQFELDLESCEEVTKEQAKTPPRWADPGAVTGSRGNKRAGRDRPRIMGSGNDEDLSRIPARLARSGELV